MTSTAAIVAIFVYGLMSALLGAALPSYHLSSSQEGTLTLSNALGLVIASSGVGPLIDFYGKKIPLLLGLSLIGLALLVAANAAFLPATYFTLGLGGGIVTTGANSLISDISPTRRSSALNFANLFFGLGGVATTCATSYFFSPSAVCYSIAALAIVALLIATQLPKAKPAPKLTYLDRQFLNPTIIWIALLLFLYVACEVGVWNWLKTYLISIHFSPQIAGGIVSYGFALGLLAGRLVVSRLLLRASALAFLLASSILIAVTTFAMLHVASQTAVTIAVFLAGFSMAPVYPTALSLIGDYFPAGTATAMGLAVTSGWLGLAISSPVIGSIAASASLRSALLVIPVLATGMVLVSLVLFIHLRKSAKT